jgi:hypothetical protein
LVIRRASLAARHNLPAVYSNRAIVEGGRPGSPQNVDLLPQRPNL